MITHHPHLNLAPLSLPKSLAVKAVRIARAAIFIKSIINLREST